MRLSPPITAISYSAILFYTPSAYLSVPAMPYINYNIEDKLICACISPLFLPYGQKACPSTYRTRAGFLYLILFVLLPIPYSVTVGICLKMRQAVHLPVLYFLTKCLGRPFMNSGCSSPIISGRAYFSYPSFRPHPSSVIHSEGTALSTLAMAWMS